MFSASHITGRRSSCIRDRKEMLEKKSTAPTAVNDPRGGNDFLVGTTAASRTFTLGISFASCTLASSYCWVRSSKTVS